MHTGHMGLLSRLTIKTRWLYGGVAALFAVLLLGWAINYFFLTPQVVQAHPFGGQTQQNLKAPLEFTVDKPVNKKKIAFSISPTIEGTWNVESEGGPRPSGTLAFTPTHYFQPDTDYTIEVNHITSMLGSQETSMTYRFHTQKQAGITKSVPAENATDVHICEPIILTLDHPTGTLSKFSFTIDPPTPFDLSQPTETEYHLKPKDCLRQNQAYTVVAARQLTLATAPVETNYTLHFHTKPAVSVNAAEPQGTQVLTSTKTLSLTFDQAMQQKDPSASLTISPALSGNWKWENDKKLTFTAEASLAYATPYTITLKEGLPDAAQGFLSPAYSYSFTTIGQVTVAAFTPYRGTVAVPVGRAVAVAFDQAVDHGSAESRFSISPSAEGGFSWSGNTLYFTGNLSKDTSYTASMGSGVKSINGLDSTQNYSTSFTMEETVTLLSVPLFSQQQPLSCEVASLRMALAYRGVTVSEGDLMGWVGYDPTPHDGDTWGDPDIAFVGSITGQQNTTGYGVHWGPIASAGAHYRTSTPFQGWSATNVADQIALGNPVIVWGTTGNAVRQGWHTPEGKYVDAWRGEHVRVVIGFKGRASDPHSFIINDPSYGRLTWSTSAFTANWATYGNSGVVVY